MRNRRSAVASRRSAAVSWQSAAVSWRSAAVSRWRAVESRAVTTATVRMAAESVYTTTDDVSNGRVPRVHGRGPSAHGRVPCVHDRGRREHGHGSRAHGCRSRFRTKCTVKSTTPVPLLFSVVTDSDLDFVPPLVAGPTQEWCARCDLEHDRDAHDEERRRTPTFRPPPRRLGRLLAVNESITVTRCCFAWEP